MTLRCRKDVHDDQRLSMTAKFGLITNYKQNVVNNVLNSGSRSTIIEMVAVQQLWEYVSYDRYRLKFIKLILAPISLKKLVALYCQP